MTTAAAPHFDPADWIALPGDTGHHVHRDDLGPCGECGATTFTLVLVRRPRGVDEAGRQQWDRSVSVECPSCRILSVKRTDQRTEIGRMDMRTGTIHERERSHAG